jgi:hypothetical protein
MRNRVRHLAVAMVTALTALVVWANVALAGVYRP